MVDNVLQIQARADADYFLAVCGRLLAAGDAQRVRRGVFAAYRWQYIVSGVREPRFAGMLGSMITADQSMRITNALAPLMTRRPRSRTSQPRRTARGSPKADSRVRADIVHHVGA